jgi:predicted enzyme related to lactoylglutathione lyase
MSMFRLFAATLAVALCSAAHSADYALAAGRVGAKDVPALARFYQQALGMKEVNRLQMGKSMEIMLNFGDTVEAAKANTQAMLIIMPREVDSDADPVPHLIFYVPDAKAAAKAVVAAGGKITTEPVAVGKSGAWIAMAVDTVGNRFEMVQRGAPAAK